MIYDIQKASLWKRFSAYLFDIILIGILAVGVAFLLSSALNYEGNLAARNEMREQYEAKHGVDFDITQEQYEKLDEQEKEAFDKAYLEFVSDPEVNKADVILINLSLIIISFSLLIAFLLLEFTVPLVLKNGQTLGKKIFGIAIIRVDGVRVSTFQMFARSILGKCTIETILPILLVLLFIFNYMPLVSIVGLFLLAVIQLLCTSITKLHTPMHELLSATVSVDMASQLIFDTPEALLEYKKNLHAAEVDNG